MEEGTRAYRDERIAQVSQQLQVGDKNPGGPSPIFFPIFHANHKILKGLLAFQPNTRSNLKKLKTVRLQGTESGPEKGGAKFGTVLGKASTSGGHSCPSQRLGGGGHQRPPKGKDEAL